MTTARQEAINARTLAIQDALTGLDRDLSDLEMDAIDAAHPIPPRKKPSKPKPGFHKGSRTPGPPPTYLLPDGSRLHQQDDETDADFKRRGDEAWEAQTSETPTRNQDAIEQASKGEFDKPTIAELEKAMDDPDSKVTLMPDGSVKTEPRGVPGDAAAIAEAGGSPDGLYETELSAEDTGGPDTLAEARALKQRVDPPQPICVAVLSFDTGPDRIMVISSPQWLEQAADTMPGDKFIYGLGQQGERWGFRLNTLRQWTCRIVTPPPATGVVIDPVYGHRTTEDHRSLKGRVE